MGKRISRDTYRYTDDAGHHYDHTEAPSIKLKPFKHEQTRNGLQIWENDLYTVTFRYYIDGFFTDNSACALLGIINKDISARHDWREFQQIKNMIVGEHWEAVELYPAESRLIDSSNEFFLWCFPAGVLDMGFPRKSRRVWQPEKAKAPQRPFPSMQPSDKEPINGRQLSG